MLEDMDKRVLSPLKRKKRSFEALLSKRQLDDTDLVELDEIFLAE